MKPNTVSIKNWLIRGMSKELGMEEDVIRDVIDHQSDGAHKAMRNNNSLELSGFGKFVFNVKKAKNLVKKLEESLVYNEELIKGLEGRPYFATELKIRRLKESLEYIKPKIDEEDI